MPQVSKVALVSYSAKQMFDLVVDINKYPEFLPWCDSSQVFSNQDQIITASLGVNYHGVKQKFTTQNQYEPGDYLNMKLLEGPFEYLDGVWHFIKLKDNACKVDFSLKFKFNNIILEKIASKVFLQIANTMLDSFIQRAKEIYG